MTERLYRSGVEKALFMLSRGRCYEPTCRQPVMRVINGEPIVDVHIAHICSHDDNGPRCAISMTAEERRSFQNLILLCKPHHTIVDRKRNKDIYPEALLLSWKHRREGDFGAELAGLDNLTEDKLQRMMAEAVQQTNHGITAAINQLAVISRGAADILRYLKAETFERPYLDLDAVASLAESARILRNLEDSAAIMNETAWKLGNLETNAATLHSAAERLENLEADAGALKIVANQIDSAVRQASSTPWSTLTTETSSVAEELSEHVVDRIRSVLPAAGGYIPSSSERNPVQWLYFKWGLGLGAGAIMAVVIAVLVMINQGH